MREVCGCRPSRHVRRHDPTAPHHAVQLQPRHRAAAQPVPLTARQHVLLPHHDPQPRECLLASFCICILLLNLLFMEVTALYRCVVVVPAAMSSSATSSLLLLLHRLEITVTVGWALNTNN